MALLKFKRSSVPGKVPTLADLELGEFALNTYDGKVYMRKDDGTASIVEVGAEAATGVLSFNSRTGAVTLTSGDVTGALGYTPANKAGDTFTGNVGIGASPLGQLHVSSGNSGDCRLIIQADADNNNEDDNPFLIFMQDGAIETSVVWSGNAGGGTNDNSLNLANSTSVGGGIKFFTGTTDGGWASAAERLRITNAGDVGINVSSPLSELDVRGVGAPAGVNVTAKRSGAAYGNAYIQLNGPRSDTADGGTVNGRGAITLLGNSSGTTTALWLNANSASLAPETADEATMRGYQAGLRIGNEGTLQFWDLGVQRFDISGSGNVTASVDLRAPIFYDSNNTAYYLDPANTGTSLLTAGGVQFYAQDGFRFTSASAYSAMRFGSSFTGESTAEIAYDRVTGTTVLSQGNTGSALTQTVAITTTGLTLAGTTHYINTDKLLLQHNGTDGYIRAVNAGSDLYLGGSNQNTLTLHTGNYAVIDGSTRSPIFYDSDDTAYYVDPAGLSNLSLVRTNEVRCRTGTQLVLNAGESSGQATGQTGELVYLNAEGGVQINSSSDNWATGWAGRYTATICNSSGNSYFPVIAEAGGDMRAPIFYDSDNTAYYADPAGTSNLNGLTVAATITGSVSGTAGSIAGFNNPTTAATPDTIVYRNSSGDDYRRYGFAQYFNMSHSVATRSSDTVFYSSTDAYIRKNNATGMRTSLDVPTRTGGDASGTWNINITGSAATATDATKLPLAGGTMTGLIVGSTSASTDVNTANDTGGLSLRGTTTTIASMSFHRAGAYAINMGLGTDNVFRIGGWSASSNAFQMSGGGSLTMLADVRAPIFYDSNDTGYYIDPTTTGTSFRGRGQLFLGPNSSSRYLRIGGDGGATDHSTVSTSNGNLHIDSQAGYDLYLNWYSARPVWSEGGAYFPIYYDRSNTAFFVDPAGTSQVKDLTVYAGLQWIKHWGGTAASPTEVYDWPYPALTVSSYGNFTKQTMLAFTLPNDGNYFTGNSVWNFRLDQTANSTTSAGVSAMRFGGPGILYLEPSSYTQTTGSMRAPIFYDSDNTVYYCDPANNSRFVSLTVSDIIANTDVRTPIFRDLDNTTYYVDPASTSVVNVLQGINLQHSAGDGNGLRFWASDSYKIYMSSTGNGTWGGRVAGETTSDYNMYFRMNGGTNRGFVFRNNTTNVAGIDASGNGRFTGDVVAYSSSDARLKENLEVIPNALEKVQALTGYTFDWNDKQDVHEAGKRDVGIIAQDVEAVLPEVVVDRELTGYKAVNYEKLVPLLIEAIKELKTEVNNLKRRIEE